MSNNTTSYTFFPAVQRGLRPDRSYDPTTTPTDTGRTEIALEVTGEGDAGTDTETARLPVRLYGPGDVTGIDERQVIRTEPSPDATAFPPNYFPLVEFDRPEFPWLFSPETTDSDGKARPWCCLVCVDRDHPGVEFSPAGVGPLPTLTAPTTELPPLAESWAWAHAQLVGEADDVAAELESRSDRTRSRLVCPRNLRAASRYLAAVVPTFAPGVRAGLGQDPFPEDTTAVTPAWSGDGEAILPVYYWWEFSTSEGGDFESLARELVARDLGPEVGYRSVDVSEPGPASLALPYDALTDVGTVGLGGALVSADVAGEAGTGTVEPDTYDATAREQLRDLLNAPETVTVGTETTTPSDDETYRTVTPPKYGQWHAGMARVQDSESAWGYNPRWFDQLNTDPRYRIAAGFGTQVVQADQEALMAAAWEQFSDIREANALFDRLQLGRDALGKRFDAISAFNPGRLLQFTRPIQSHVVPDVDRRETLLAHIEQSTLPDLLATTAFRRFARPQGPLARRDAVLFERDALETRLETATIPGVGGGDTFVDGPLEAGGTYGTGTPIAEGLDTTSVGRVADGKFSIAPDRIDAVENVDLRFLNTDGGWFTDAGDEDSEFWTTFDGPASGGGQAPTESAVDSAREALDAVDEQLATVDRRLAALGSALKTGDRTRMRSVVAKGTRIDDRTRGLGDDAVDQLSRRLAVVVESASGERVGGFSPSAATKTVDSMASDARAVTKMTESVTSMLRTDARPTRRRAWAMERRVAFARSRLERIRARSDRLRGYLDVPELDQPVVTETVPPERNSTTPMRATAPDADALADIQRSLLDELNPALQAPAVAAARLGLDPTTLAARDDPVERVMAGPVYTRAMYRDLARLDQEYLLPGVGDIPKNTVGAVRTNPPFVEAFMVGLNHEMARELQWRGFPTDKQGTYFRRFWDRAGSPRELTVQDVGDLIAGAADPLADIDRIHEFDESDLGDNQASVTTDPKVVLLIRGELFRRYPNTTIYAAKAVEDRADGDPEGTGDRVPALPNTHATEALAEDDPGILFPQFRGQLDPDITFFGFDLSVAEAVNAPYHEGDIEPDDHPDEGWFFVLEEPPGDPRFGLDESQGDVGTTPAGVKRGDGEYDTEWALGEEVGWGALSWGHMVPHDAADGAEDPESLVDEGAYLSVSESAPAGNDGHGEAAWRVDSGQWFPEDAEPIDAASAEERAMRPQTDTWTEDDAAIWGQNAAHMARITWQQPVRVAIHADDMLPDPDDASGGGA